MGKGARVPVYREEPMRWIHAAGRGLLVLVVVMTGYVASGARAEEGTAGGRGPLTLATAGDLTNYLDPLLQGWNRTHPGEKVTLVELPDSADETHAQMVTDLRGGGTPSLARMSVR